MTICFLIFSKNNSCVSFVGNFQSKDCYTRIVIDSNMVEFKLCIGDPKTGKSHQIIITGDNADSFMGKKIADKIKGEKLDLPGYEFEITGGADYCGFPMRKDVSGPVRKKILLVKGVGIRNKEKGIKKRSL